MLATFRARLEAKILPLAFGKYDVTCEMKARCRVKANLRVGSMAEIEPATEVRECLNNDLHTLSTKITTNRTRRRSLIRLSKSYLTYDNTANSPRN
jgi:hypothetical protein